MAPTARCAIIVTDSFSYPDGPLVEVSTNQWGTNIWAHSNGTTTGEVQVVSGKVLLSQTNTEDVSVSLGQSYPTTTNILLYASFTIRFTRPPVGAGDYFAHFKGSGTAGFRDKIYATTNGVPAGFFRVGVANAENTAPNAVISSNLSFGTDYTLVTRYALSNASSTLWLNPASEADSSITAGDLATASPENAFGLRENDGIGALYFDNLIIGTSFSEVVAAVPPTIRPTIVTQPHNGAVAAGADAVFTVLATGSAPLSYQWQFYGTNLAGATSSALALSNVTTNQAGPYSVTITNAGGSTNSQSATLTVSPVTVVSILTYNVLGAAATDWSTNSPQVQAIGRQMQYLRPDIITFQEIPMDLAYEMTNFVNVFLPGYFLVTSPTADGFTRSSIASRFPIARSQSWLAHADLDPFGYTNSNFTRDLYEAQVSVPNFDQPLHVFTVHLKSGSSSDETAKRNAEGLAVSNYFVTVLLTTNASHPYVLTGDLNETDTNKLSIQCLISPPTGLQFTTPVNPISGSALTYSIQNASGLNKRFDYILPCGMLFTNISGSEVFRTDLLTNPPPPLPVLTNDDSTASDHLPVLMSFGNPFNRPFRLLSIGLTNQLLTLGWESANNRQYRIEVSSNLADWEVFAASLTATGATRVFSTNVTGPEGFFRVYRVP